MLLKTSVSNKCCSCKLGRKLNEFFKGVMECLCFIFILYCSLRSTYNVIIFLHEKTTSFKSNRLFSVLFWLSHQNALFEEDWRIVDSEVNAHCCDWLTLVYVWQSTSFTDGCCCDLSINNSILYTCVWRHAVARLVFNEPKRAHVTPLFISLHWLPVAPRIKFKTLMLAYRTTTGSAPTYFHSLTITNLRNLHPLQKSEIC